MEANVKFINNNYSLNASSDNYKFDGNYNKYDNAKEIKCVIIENEERIGELTYVLADNGMCYVQCQVHSSKLSDIIAQIDPLIEKIEEKQ